MAVGFEGAKVVLFVRIVGVTEVVLDRDGLDDSLDGLRTEGGNAGSHHSDAVGKVLAQLVGEFTNPIGLGFHGEILVG